MIPSLDILWTASIKDKSLRNAENFSIYRQLTVALETTNKPSEFIGPVSAVLRIMVRIRFRAIAGSVLLLLLRSSAFEPLILCTLIGKLTTNTSRRNTQEPNARFLTALLAAVTPNRPKQKIRSTGRHSRQNAHSLVFPLKMTTLGWNPADAESCQSSCHSLWCVLFCAVNSSPVKQEP